MKFIDLFFACNSIAARIGLETDPDGGELFVAAGKISQSTANELQARLAPGINLAERVSVAARRLGEALQDADHPKPKLFKYDRTCISPAGDDAWSRMMSLLFQARFWGVRERRYCLDYFRRATTEGEYFLHNPIDRHETDNWLIPNGNALGLPLLGFDSDELFTFLDANKITYEHLYRPEICIEEMKHV